MKQSFGTIFLIAGALFGTAFSIYGQSLDLISTVDPAPGPAPGGGGDSFASVISPDGRYVLFASTANNLVVMTNNQPIPASIPANLNAYLRDRVNKTTTLISVDLTGTMGGDGDSLPVGVSTNGRYVLFESTASNLVPGDDNFATDVFVRDVVKGTTTLVSANVDGFPGDDSSDNSAMTPDGRYVVFVSAADDLVDNDTNQIPDIFVRDLQTGTTVLASAGALSTNSISPIGGSDAPDITPDGRYVVFYSTATNLVPGVPPGGDVYVRDLISQTTTWASIGARAAISNAFHSTTAVSYNQAISADGQFVAYETSSGANTTASYSGLILRYNLATGVTDLVYTNATAVNSAYESARSLTLTPDGRFIAFIANTNDSSTTCVQLWDATTGISTLASGDSNNGVQPNSTCDWPLVDPSGRFVAFLSNATNLTTNPLVGDYHLYRRNMQTSSTVLVDADTNGVGSPISFATLAQMTADGRWITFDCSDSQLVPNDRNRAYDVFARDLVTATTELISAHDPALPCITANGPSLLAATSVSADGRFVAFASEAENLTPNDTNGVRDIFVRDLATGKTQLVSVDTNGFSADGASTEPAISLDGRYVAFSCYADNLVAGDNNKAQDVFLRDLQLGVTTLVSVNTNGTGSNGGAAYSPIVSSNGRYVLFRSLARDLASGVFSGENLFLRDMQASTTYALSTFGVNQLVPSMTPDGRFILYAALPSFAYLNSALYLWDSQAANRVYTNNVVANSGSLSAIALSADGSRIAFSAVTNAVSAIQTVDLATGQTTLLDSSGSDKWSGLRLSADGSRLACLKTSRPIGTNQVYVYGLMTGTNLLVSHAFNSPLPANGASDSVDISSDGRLMAYRSFASDIVPGDSNDLPDIIAYDTQTGLNSLLSSSRLGNFAADNRSLSPVFSGDGRTLCFVSWGSDIVPLDFNYSSDVFAYTFLSASLLADQTLGHGPWIAWPNTQGKNYRVQFKNATSDPLWHDLPGAVTNLGNRAYLQDTTPAPIQRFYRITSF
jgi:Tol biopolymer transport system component